jgi:hypothetical protein
MTIRRRKEVDAHESTHRFVEAQVPIREAALGGDEHDAEHEEEDGEE